MKVLKSIVSVVAVFLYWLLYQLWLPTLSLGYLDGVLFIGIGVIALVLLITWWFSDDEYHFAFPAIALGIVVLVVIVGGVAGSALFNSTAMYNQIGEINQKSFKDDLLEVDTSQIPVVDIELANKLADKKMGEDVALGSQMEIGEFTNKQSVNGKLVYVAPLEHRSFWKWNSNKAGTTGYIIVSATNANDVKLVRTLGDNEQISLRYLSSSFFGDDLKRYLRSHGYRSVGLTEYSFELNDEGRPYWVVTTYRNTTVWGNPEATGVVVCDPQTGECNWYSVEDTPEWVDIIQPESFVVKQLKNYGKYVHGVWNFSDKDKLSVTEHITTVYNQGDCYYYTGMSSVGKDNGTVGFMLVNTRTKDVKMYRMVGATEEAAMRSAEGKVQNMGYQATTPIPLNISGIPTYFCTLKDAEGLVKQYAMLNIEDYSIVETGSTIMEAKRSYINSVNNSGAVVDFGNEAYGYTIEGVVTRIGYNIEDGNTYYYLILNDDTTKLFLASYMVSEELPITREGDKVKVSYVDQLNGTINIVYFDNIDFSQNISDKQQELDSEKEENNVINNPSNNVTNIDPEADQEAWDNLTDEEKAKLIDQLEGSNGK